jgi:type III restriction enzyme
VSGAAAARSEVSGEALFALADYQVEARDALRDTVKRVAGLQITEPARREAIARELGVMLLQAPTASGKTLILGRTLESLRGAVLGKFVWFWFTPFTGLVEQTRDALAAQCPSLRLRDIATDRVAAGTRDGDVFIQTWATVAAQNAEARRVRRRAEDSGSIDDLLAELRERDFSVGVVIDEAHLNFNSTARAAASFYLDVLRPDATILATATPNDAKLASFEREAGIRVESEIAIARERVVAAGLNKPELHLGVVRFSDEDGRLVDPEQAALAAGWRQHTLVKEELARRNVAITPLMFVQVEDQKKGEPDPVERVRAKLLQLRVPPSAIRAHTSGAPDPDFHALAHDPDVEVLIFKVAVATGFDAPRAWTLVSVRPNRGVEFGLQIVGRIMRVHPAVRFLAERPRLLDGAYVFVTDPELQAGLDGAARELSAVRSSISTIASRLNVFQFGSGRPIQPDLSPLPSPAPIADRVERLRRIEGLVARGVLNDLVYRQPDETQVRMLQAAEAGLAGDLFGGLPVQPGPEPRVPAAARMEGYRLNPDLGIPDALLREELPAAHQIGPGFAAEVAREFVRHINLTNYLVNRGRIGRLTLRELFEGSIQTANLNVPISEARAADLAQRSFEFNDQIDPRDLKRAILAAFAEAARGLAIETDERTLRRAVDLAALENDGAMREAVRIAQRAHLIARRAEPVPAVLPDEPGREPAIRAAHGVFPSGMNAPEAAFARFLDADRSDTVLWWLRCVENTRWAPKLVLPDGHNFFPDFAVGVARRSKADGIALVEIKDDGRDGRLHSDVNLLKSRVDHKAYGKVFWATRHGEDLWARMVFDPSLNRLREAGAFDLRDLVLD